MLAALFLPVSVVAASATTADPPSCAVEIFPSQTPPGKSSSAIDPSQLVVSWPRTSHLKQPWRGYLETVPGTWFLEGLGVHWGADAPGTAAEMAKSLARAGFRRVRLEIPWGGLAWDETRFEPHVEARIMAILGALRRNGLRPLVLLNAHHAAPTPFRVITVRVPDGAVAGARTIAIEGDVSLVEAGKAQLVDFLDAVRPGPLVTGLDAKSGILTLSRPLPGALEPGHPLRLVLLKYAPLQRAGTARFRETLEGWRRYVTKVTKLLAEAYGSDDYEVEVWNELTFGFAFLDVGFYAEPPRPTTGNPDFLRRGGTAWELADATVQLMADIAPGVRVIWGFSNTTFFHTPIADLPPGFDGQSYHPYGTERRCYSDRDRVEAKTIDGFVPDYCVAMPEGWAHTFLKTESLMRLLEPRVRRARRPPEAQSFDHYITEHGLEPTSVGAGDPRSAARAKAKFLLRAPLFWLHKGIRAFYGFQAYDPTSPGMGLLGSAPEAHPVDALARLVDAFGAPEPLGKTRPLGIDVSALSRPEVIFKAPRGARALTHLDVVTVLPFQLAPKRFVVAAYVMTRDFPADLAPEPYEIRIAGLGSRGAAVRVYDPLSDSEEVAEVCPAAEGTLRVRLALNDSPRLLIVTER